MLTNKMDFLQSGSLNISDIHSLIPAGNQNAKNAVSPDGGQS